MKRMTIAGALLLALTLGTGAAWAKIPPPPPPDEKAKAAAEEKKAKDAVAAEKGKADHRRQANLYMKAEGLATAYLVYVVKDATKGEPIIHAYLVEYDKGEANNDLLASGRAALISRSGPGPPPTSSIRKPSSRCKDATLRPARN
jgi:hypothetical protein